VCGFCRWCYLGGLRRYHQLREYLAGPSVAGWSAGDQRHRRSPLAACKVATVVEKLIGVSCVEKRPSPSTEALSHWFFESSAYAIEGDTSISFAEQNRRKNPRFKTRVPIEFRPEGTGTLTGATADLSLGGCYLEMMFTFPVGTILEVCLRIGHTVHAKAIVVTRDLQVGNGLKFIDLLPEDQDALRGYLDTAVKEKLPEA
jgi:hypothetical protein